MIVRLLILGRDPAHCVLRVYGDFVSAHKPPNYLFSLALFTLPILFLPVWPVKYRLLSQSFARWTYSKLY
jgi:hypothetical protein